MRTVFQSDFEAIAACPRNLTIRAMRGHSIVWFLPYRRGSGVIEIPDKYQDQSAEAIIIHDNGPHGLAPGVKVCASRLAGEYFEIGGHRLCRMPSESVILVDTEFSPEIA